MRFRLLLALFILASLGAASADESSPAQATQSLAFRPVDEILTLKKHARIYDRPGGKAIFQLRVAGALVVDAVSEDGRWYEVVLPNGAVGYVPASFVDAP